MLREPYPRALFCHNRTWHQRRYWSSIPVNTTQRTCHTKSLQHPKSFLLQTAIIAMLGHYWSTMPRTQGLYCVKYHDWTPEEGFRDSRQEEPSASHIRWRNEIKENAVHLRKVVFVIYRDITVGFGAQEVHTVSPCHSQGTCTDPSAATPHFKAAAGWTKRSIHSVQPQGLPCPYRYSICGSCHQRTSDSQQGSLTEQPKHSRLVMSTNWEEEKSNFKEA